jgi:hypothetical protein
MKDTLWYLLSQIAFLASWLAVHLGTATATLVASSFHLPAFAAIAVEILQKVSNI